MTEPHDLYSQLAFSASKTPKNTALVCSHKKWSYHRLLHCCDRAADMFWSLGIRKEDRVVIALKNSPEFIITHFALAKLGAVSVPVNFMVSKEEELGFIVGNCHAKGVVTQKDFITPYLHLQKKLPALNFIISTDHAAHNGHILDFSHLLKTSHSHAETQKANAGPADAASILYTSGTTGHPKGVILTHGNLLANARSCAHAMHLTKKDAFLCILPMFHTFSWTTTVMAPLLLGSKILIAPQIVPAKPWLSEMGKEGVTVMAAVPQLFSVLAKEARGLKKFYLRYWPFRKMRFCFSGAAPLSASIKHLFEKNFGIPLLEGYGLTETSPVVSVNRPHSRKHGSVGQPIPGVTVRIIDDLGCELSSGEEGEICVKGPNVTRGYHSNPAATVEIFTPDGWLKTGDIGVMDEDGFLFIRDRKKDMIIVKGLKVFPAQLEMVLHEHPGVAETAVIGVPDPNGDELIKCFCVARPGHVLDKAEIMSFLRQKLDPYKRPREIELVESLPKNALQKVLKRVLRQKEIEKRAAAAADRMQVIA
ncbi:MAG: long-chain-fatty-acid--CoA ligase [bacterium]